MRIGFPSPTNAVALLLVAGGLLGLGNCFGRARSPGSAPCDPGSDAACTSVDGARRGEGPDRDGTPPTLSAQSACLRTAYLCADLENVDRIRLQRWKGFSGTLVVHVPLPDLADAAAARRLQRAATAGVRLWNGQPFPILVDERGTRSADVEVRWVQSLGGSRIGLAQTAWSPVTGLKVRAIQLVTHSPFRDRTVDPQQLRLTAAHEMGHALGLPHSNEPRDVMYPTNTATSLSARDYRTLEALYDLPDGTEIVR